MEQEAFFSGYCKTIDGSRMVAVVAEGNALLEADCLYENCPYAPGCPIAEKIGAFLSDPASM